MAYASPLEFNAARARYAAEIERVLGSQFKPELYGPAGGALAQFEGDVDAAATSACLDHDTVVFPVLAAFEAALKASNREAA